jgi:predicted RNase H-like HicB family nuclease
LKKDRYIYPAIFEFNDDGISVEFPDLPGCLTCGDTIEEAAQNAKEALGLHLYSMEQDGDSIPEPTSVTTIKPKSNQVVMLIEVWMPIFRDTIENKAVKKTLTIPKWLDDLAQQHKVNFSHLLQNALKEKLGIHDRP